MFLIDDILVYPPTGSIIGRISASSSVKCVFGQSSIKFLGWRISARGIESLPEEVVYLVAMPPSGDVTECRRYS